MARSSEENHYSNQGGHSFSVDGAEAGTVRLSPHHGGATVHYLPELCEVS